MSPLWVRFLLLLFYLALLLLVVGLVELIQWWKDPTLMIPPLALSIRQLQSIVHMRGLSYVGLVEKQELIKLVEDSGGVSQAEVLEVSNEEEINENNSKPFLGGTHLWEQVEDCKDSVWLVQVVATGELPVLDLLSWRKVGRAMTPLGVRMGTLHCNSDPKLCVEKGWFNSQLLLALPKGSKAKGKVQLTAFTSRKSQSVISWVQQELLAGVSSLSLSSLPSFLSPNWNGSHVAVLLISALAHPPLFLSALAYKFSGRVKFGFLSVKSKEEEEAARQKIGNHKLPTYIIALPTSNNTTRLLHYGSRPSELKSFQSMGSFLRSLQPEMNDWFILSVVVVNLLALFELFMVNDSGVGWLWSHSLHCLTLVVVYNMWLFVGWLLLLSVAQTPLMLWLSDVAMKLVMGVMETDCAAYVRAVWYIALSHPGMLVATFVLFGVSTGLLWWIWRDSHPPRVSGDRAWWQFGESPLVDCLFRPLPPSPSTPFPSPHWEQDIEEGLDLFIQRMATPNLWLQPVVNSHYIKDLPQWHHTCDLDGCESTNEESSMSDGQYSSEESTELLKSCGAKCCNSANNSSNRSLCNCCKPPSHVIWSNECPVCLERYKRGCMLCCLPCGHSYHDRCIKLWLGRDNHHCPICRWPAYKHRPKRHCD